MPVQVLFVQGAGDGTHDHWDNRLAASLQHHLGDGYVVRYPRMPDESAPHFVAWKSVLLELFETMHDGDVLVGHSNGGLFLLHTLADTAPPFAPAGLYLLATPFIGAGGWPAGEIASCKDLARLLPPHLTVRLYHGTADGTVPYSHAALYREALPQAVVRVRKGGDHQFGNDLREIADDIKAAASADAVRG